MKCFPIFILLLAIASPAWAQEVKTLDGHTYVGSVRLDREQICIKTAEREIRVDPANLQQASFNPPVETHAKPSPSADPVIPANSHGWLGTYYRDRFLVVPLLTRVDPAIDFDWRPAKPDPRLDGPFSVCWIAQLTPPKTDLYTFNTVSRGGVQVSIDGKLLIDRWREWAGNGSHSVSLEAGKPVSIVVNFYNAAGDAGMRLLWSNSTVKKDQPIPAEYVTPPSADLRRELLKPHGLRGEYFDDDTFKTICFRRHDLNVDFHYDLGWGQWPDSRLPEKFGARWTGKLLSPGTGEYKLYFQVDDAGRVSLDGKVVIDCWDKNVGEFSAPYAFRAGETYDLKIDFSNRGGQGAAAHLFWSGPNRPKQLIDPAHFSPPSGDAVFDPQVVLKPPVKPLFEPGEAILLSAEPSADESGRIKRVQFMSDDKPIGVAAAAPYVFNWENPPIGRHMVTAVAIDQKEFQGTSSRVPFTVAAKAPAGMGDGWMDYRVGNPPGAADSASLLDGNCTVSAAAGDLWTASDAFHYIVHQLDGDGSLVVHLNSVKGTAPANLACAGIMVRQDLTPGAPNAAVMVLNSPDPSLVFLHRDSIGGDLNFSGNPVKMPIWLRIERIGTHLKAFSSPTSERWTLIGETDLPSSPTLFIGLAVAAKNEGSASAVFDHMDLQTGRPTPVTSTAGVETRDGSVLAGEIISADSDKIALRFRGQILQIKTSDAARLLFRSVPAEMDANIGAGKKGVLLSTGDFSDGDFAGLAYGQVSISSVLFGKQSFGTDTALAVLLNDLTPSAGYIVTASDGSMYRAPSIAVVAGKLQINNSVAGAISLSGEEVRSIVKSGG